MHGEVSIDADPLQYYGIAPPGPVRLLPDPTSYALRLVVAHDIDSARQALRELHASLRAASLQNAASGAVLPSTLAALVVVSGHDDEYGESAQDDVLGGLEDILAVMREESLAGEVMHGLK